MKLGDIVVIKDYSAAREWAVKNGFTLVKVKSGYKITKPSEIGEVEKAHRIRQQRNALLAETDFTQLPDAALTDEEKARFASYRKYLRDISEEDGFPNVDLMTYSEWEEGVKDGE